MALDVDGFAILRAIGEAPGRYGAIDGDVRKAARALVAKQMKSKGLGLSGLRGLRESLGEEALELVLDGMGDAETGRVLAGVDTFYPNLKTAPSAELRRRIVELAAGADASPKPPRGGKKAARAPAAPKAPKVASVNSPAFAAVWDGKDHDAPTPRRPGRKS